MGFVLEHLEFGPIGQKAFVDIEIGVVNGMRWYLDLNIASGLEVDPFSRRQGKDEFFDEGGDIFVRGDGAPPLL